MSDQDVTNIEWVGVRAACSLAAIFEKIKMDLRSDVEQRQALRPQGCHYGFNMESNSHAATVFVEGRGIRGSIQFRLTQTTIDVYNSNDQMILRATPTLNVKGECLLKLDKLECPSWYFRKMALEELFFREY